MPQKRTKEPTLAANATSPSLLILFLARGLRAFVALGARAVGLAWCTVLSITLWRVRKRDDRGAGTVDGKYSTHL